MGLSKAKNLFDPANLGDEDNVGAFLRSSDGTLLTHTTEGAKEALDVYLVNEQDVQIDGDYDVSTNADPDSVGMIGHDRGASPDKTSQNFRFTGGKPNSDNLDPANIHALDANAFLMAWDGAAWDRLEKTDNGLKVDIGDSIEIEVSECYTDLATGSTGVIAAGETLIGGVANRCGIDIFNTGKKPIYIGKTGVTSSTGFKIPSGGSYFFKAGATGLYAICAATESSSISFIEHVK